MKKFENLDDLIGFEKNLNWVNSNELNLDNYHFESKLVKGKYNKLVGEKILGVYGGSIVTAVSPEFKHISVGEVANYCESEFGGKYTEKSFRQGIVRIYETGIRDKIGKITPMVVYPSNLGSMAVKIGLHHEAKVCSNGLVIADNILNGKIIHRGEKNIISIIRNVSNNMGKVLTKIEQAQEIELNPGLQLGMIVLGLNKKTSYIDLALNKYTKDEPTLWNTIQAITYVATHHNKMKGYEYSKNAGDILFTPNLKQYEILDAASFVMHEIEEKKKKYEHGKDLFKLAKASILC